MASAVKYGGQILVYAVIAAVLGYFSASPAFRHFPEDMALIKLAFAHGAKPKGKCRTLSAKEIAALPPNMRRPKICPRERLPVFVELELNGELIYRKALPPTGLHGDGPARVYEGFPVPAGRHALVVRLRDSDRSEGFDYVRATDVTLEPARKFVVDFRSELGGFIFK
ncbi:MAG: hypothetical protein QNJ94_09750 [Alphaproteobacteria bacterium]|nr:hypothetical protein [Alphaproteobacteria bacterium]